MNNDGDANHIWCPWNRPQRPGKTKSEVLQIFSNEKFQKEKYSKIILKKSENKKFRTHPQKTTTTKTPET